MSRLPADSRSSLRRLGGRMDRIEPAMRYRPTGWFEPWLLLIAIVCGTVLPAVRACGDLTLDAGCLEQLPEGVRIGVTSQHLFADSEYGERVKREKPFVQYVNCVRLLGGRHDGWNAWFQGIDEDGHVSGCWSSVVSLPPFRGHQHGGGDDRD